VGQGLLSGIAAIKEVRLPSPLVDKGLDESGSGQDGASSLPSLPLFSLNFSGTS
jgi:hypothetical protein